VKAQFFYAPSCEGLRNTPPKILGIVRELTNLMRVKQIHCRPVFENKAFRSQQLPTHMLCTHLTQIVLLSLVEISLYPMTECQ